MNQALAEQIIDKIQKCAICGRLGPVSNVLGVPVNEKDRLAIGICGQCACLPHEQLAKIVYGLVEVYQTRASHLSNHMNSN